MALDMALNSTKERYAALAAFKQAGAGGVDTAKNLAALMAPICLKEFKSAACPDAAKTRLAELARDGSIDLNDNNNWVLTPTGAAVLMLLTDHGRNTAVMRVRMH